ncbi:glycine cleavage system aminomethyltransferase GcvT [Amnimonas aquatica]|uniref:Aminomethyltransferase n=1 Tax=Amnimonas aquatica TaxID=2094561 RepID=A0A2P6AT23_9GAMM|nr:glycine cleavage system aminomethyltransferase GcvT [Amnimonas aquatica]PQA44884.1 glycine cleavage system protein T [Amnimonas aquatica]
MGLRTPLYDEHLALNARMVDFGGWDMPVQYASVLDEHHAVRRTQGMFDVSHMTLLELAGPDAVPYLRRLLANDVARLQTPGKALYSTMLDEQGGVIDDLIVYAPTDAGEALPEGEPAAAGLWRVIVNCGTHDKDLAWMQRQAASFRVSLRERTDLAMIAVQGPQARATVAGLLGGETAERIAVLPVFQGFEPAGLAGDWFIARTGYTGEDGLELMLPASEAPAFWRRLLAAGVAPCGLGARDTLRLEAGMPLYGNDMSEAVSPLVSNLGWTIAWDHDFIGKAALEAERDAGVKQRLVGLVLEGKGVLRAHMRVVIPGADGTVAGEGETTSGTFSPTLEKAIAFARIPVTDSTEALVDIRGKLQPARIVKPVFARSGKPLI